ncbi:ester cyclase [Blastococcus sp. SYSU D00669]
MGGRHGRGGRERGRRRPRAGRRAGRPRRPADAALHDRRRRVRGRGTARRSRGTRTSRGCRAPWRSGCPPTYRISTGRVLVAGDGYAVERVLEGTKDRADPEFGLPATGNRFSLRGVSTGRLRDGRIAENHDCWNMADFLAQLGQLSGLGAEPAAG